MFAAGPIVVLMLLSILAAAGAVYSRFRKSLAVATVVGVLLTIGLISFQRRGDVDAARSLPAATPVRPGDQCSTDRNEANCKSEYAAVSIPNIHETGQLEGPSILRLEVQPEPDKHIVVQRISRWRTKRSTPPCTSTWRSRRIRICSFSCMATTYRSTPPHSAPRRYAKDVEFQGAAIFYSWPSQNGLLGYTIDEQNVSWTVTDLKRFLLDVVQQSKARSDQPDRARYGRSERSPMRCGR